MAAAKIAAHPLAALGRHCCSCIHFRCEMGCEPDAAWVKAWKREFVDGDPLFTLAADCPHWTKEA